MTRGGEGGGVRGEGIDRGGGGGGEVRIATVHEKGMEPLVEGTLARWFTEGFRAPPRPGPRPPRKD